MRLLRLIVMLSGLVGLTAAQSQCDPLTQYASLGECCNMCGPGTSMTSLGTCLEPQCHVCDKDEYQDKYTKESKCQRQPYCDPNLNFGIPDHDSKKQTTCLCKNGFHCASEQCYSCVPHTPCKPGYQVTSEGNHSRDTVCGKCPEGTFSDGKSSLGVCTKWTVCKNGQIVQQSGTDVSDNICGTPPRTHLIAILLAVILLVIIAIVVWVLKCKGKHGKANIKQCVEDYWGEKEGQLKEVKLLSSASANHNEEISTLHECSQDTDTFPRTPEENVHEPSQVTQQIDSGSMSDLGLTDKGNYVKQEMGKTERLSRQESQTQTFNSSL